MRQVGLSLVTLCSHPEEEEEEEEVISEISRVLVDTVTESERETTYWALFLSLLVLVVELKLE